MAKVKALLYMKWLSSAPRPAAGNTNERVRVKRGMLFYAQIAHKRTGKPMRPAPSDWLKYSVYVLSLHQS